MERQSDAPTIVYAHDDLHRLVRASRISSGEDRILTSTRFEYDEDNGLTIAQIDEEPPWRYVNSVWGETTRVELPTGAVVQHSFDENGALVETVDEDGHVWGYTRDLLGRVTSQTNPLGHVWHVQWLDADGQSLQITEPDGRSYARLVSQDERTIKQVMPAGRSRMTELSSCGEIIAIHDEEGGVTRIDWGTEPGEITRVISANGEEYRFGYDADMRLVARRTFDGRVLRIGWALGRVAWVADAEGRRTEYVYDNRGFAVELKTADGATKFDYDDMGFLRGLSSPGSRTTFVRDRQGRTISEEQDGVRISRAYDALGRIVSEKSSLGHEARFSWSPSGCLTGLGYRELGIRIEYDGAGQEVQRTLGEAGTFGQAYDAAGRLLAQIFRTREANSTTPGVARSFQYDARGFLSAVSDSLRGTTRLLQNNRGDLVGVVREVGGSDFYAYDPCRNRTLKVTTSQGPILAAMLEQAIAHGTGAPVDILARQVPHLPSSAIHGPGGRLEVVQQVDGRTEITHDTNGQASRRRRCEVTSTRPGGTPGTRTVSSSPSRLRTAKPGPTGTMVRGAGLKSGLRRATHGDTCGATSASSTS